MNRRDVLTILGGGGLIATAGVACAAPEDKPGDKIKLENARGFDTLQPGEFFRAYWESLKDHHKMQGRVSDHLTRKLIDQVIVLEVKFALTPEGPGVEGELLAFMTRRNRFHTGPLPEDFDKDRRPLKNAVALFRTEKGDYGLITRYRELAVIELNGRVGVAPITPAAPALNDGLNEK